MDSALDAYERRISENHDEQESGPVDDELVERCVKIVAVKHALYEIFCKDGNLTMAIEYLTAYTHTLIMACEITGLSESHISKRVKECEECLRTSF